MFLAKTIKKRILLFKVDFNKAFYYIKWASGKNGDFGFMVACHRLEHQSLLMDGSATKEFDITIGVRQGHLLSSSLFIIEIEGLNVTLKYASEKCVSKSVKIPSNGPLISHLFMCMMHSSKVNGVDQI